MAEAGVDATHPSRDTSLSRRVRTLVRFCFLMAALCFLVVAHFGRCFNTTANMRRCLFYRKSCFRHSFKATANRSVKIQGGMIRFCPEYSIKSTLKLAVSPNSPLVIHPIYKQHQTSLVKFRYKEAPLSYHYPVSNAVLNILKNISMRSFLLSTTNTGNQRSTNF